MCECNVRDISDRDAGLHFALGTRHQVVVTKLPAEAAGDHPQLSFGF